MTARPSPHQRAARLVAVLLLAAGWGVPLAFPHLIEDDLLCAVPAGPGGDGQQLIEGSEASAVDHCAVCHSLRSFRSAAVADDFLRLALDSRRHQAVIRDARIHGAAALRLPARAPPA